MKHAFASLVFAVSVFAGHAAMAQQVINEQEPNNSRTQAQTISIVQGVVVNGTAGTSTDSDYYRVGYFPGGECLVADLVPNPESNYNLYVVNGSGTILASSQNGVGQADFVTVCNAQGPLFVWVRYASGLTGAAGTYTLTVGL